MRRNKECSKQGLPCKETRLCFKCSNPAEPRKRFMAGPMPLSARGNQKADLSVCFFLWSGLRGSNPPPPPWQGGALPNELNPQVFNLIGDSDGARSRHELRALVAVGSDSPPDCHSLPPLFEPVMTDIKRWRLGWGSNPRPLA